MSSQSAEVATHPPVVRGEESRHIAFELLKDSRKRFLEYQISCSDIKGRRDIRHSDATAGSLNSGGVGDSAEDSA